RTSWWRNVAAAGLAGWVCETRRDDVLAGGGTGTQPGQQGGFARRDETTHSLVPERGRSCVSRVDLRDETRRRTSWWRNGAAAGSAGWICETRRVDARTGDGTGPQLGQQRGFARQDNTRRHTSWW